MSASPAAPSRHRPRCSGRYDVYDQLTISAEREEGNNSLWRYEDKPAEMDADGNHLVCWATTDNGENVYCLIQPGDTPDSHPILINDESGEDWERYGMTVTQFLSAVLSGEARSRILWDEFPLGRHQFRPARQM
ncbi:hypothetical protein ACFVZD_32475 [Streptomyces sp. NPDC058287]|uniref:hypothetical protein n=1 Tax=unclassified Streptomyces TaxID=2593676 RepID=UPI0036E56E86